MILTVKELIEKLKKYPEDKEVVFDVDHEISLDNGVNAVGGIGSVSEDVWYLDEDHCSGIPCYIEEDDIFESRSDDLCEKFNLSDEEEATEEQKQEFLKGFEKIDAIIIKVIPR